MNDLKSDLALYQIKRLYLLQELSTRDDIKGGVLP